MAQDLFEMATKFDPYGAFREGQLKATAYDIKQMGLEEQKREMQQELADQAKPTTDLGAGLQKQANQMVPAGWKLTGADGMPTVAGQFNDLSVQASTAAKDSARLVKQARFETDPVRKERLMSEGRRLRDESLRLQKDGRDLVQKTMNNTFYALGTAETQEEWDNAVKGFENSGIPIPPNMDTTFSPENKRKVIQMAPMDVQSKINKELRDRDKEERNAKSQEIRDNKILAALQGNGKMSNEQARSQRAINALGGVKSALETINEFEIGTNVGMLPSLTTKDGMTNAIRNYAGRKVTKVSADQLNTVFSGIGRNLAAIETSGLATGLAELSKSLQSGVYINPGKDDPYSVAMKLADIRRIAVENIKPAIDSGAITPKQAEAAQALINQIETLVPYTTTDVAKATREAKGKGKPTIKEATEKAIKGQGAGTKEDPIKLD